MERIVTGCFAFYFGKAGDFNPLWPENLDHLKSELNPCNIDLYVKANLTG